MKHQRGGDKTVVGSLIAAKLGQPTLIVVTKNDLTVAWKQALNQILGIPLSMIGQVQQDMCDWKGKQFVIGMLHSLIIEDRYPEEMYRHFGLMIVDEVHLVAAEHFQEICWKVPAKHRIGFSATPTRKDGRDRLLKAHIGETLVKGYLVPMKPKVLVKKTGWQIPMYRDRETMGLVKIPHQPGRMMGVVKAQANNQNRNLLILEFVLATFKNGRRTVIMADTLDHLDRLFQIFTSGGISGDKIGFYVGQMSQADLDFNKEKPVILATYRMVSTGTNVPKWDTLVLATPRSDVKQMIGRVLRFLTDKKQPVILDLLDDDKLLHNFHLSRLRQYYAVGAEIVYV